MGAGKTAVLETYVSKREPLEVNAVELTIRESSVGYLLDFRVTCPPLPKLLRNTLSVIRWLFGADRVLLEYLI